jgi:hypothetical protein
MAFVLFLHILINQTLYKPSIKVVKTTISITQINQNNISLFTFNARTVSQNMLSHAKTLKTITTFNGKQL